MKTKDTWAAWEEEFQKLKLQRHQITEQAGCPMIRFVVDGAACILPYSYFTRAECHIQNDYFQITAVWPVSTVTIEGYHLDELTNLLAEHRLHSVTLRTAIEQERKEGQPYIERVSFAPTAVEGVCDLTSGKLLDSSLINGI